MVIHFKYLLWGNSFLQSSTLACLHRGILLTFSTLCLHLCDAPEAGKWLLCTSVELPLCCWSNSKRGHLKHTLYYSPSWQFSSHSAFTRCTSSQIKHCPVCYSQSSSEFSIFIWQSAWFSKCLTCFFLQLKLVLGLQMLCPRFFTELALAFWFPVWSKKGCLIPKYICRTFQLDDSDHSRDVWKASLCPGNACSILEIRKFSLKMNDFILSVCLMQNWFNNCGSLECDIKFTGWPWAITICQTNLTRLLLRQQWGTKFCILFCPPNAVI